MDGQVPNLSGCSGKLVRNVKSNQWVLAGGAYQGTLSVAAINVESRQLLWMTAPAHARTIEVHLLPLGPFSEEMACHGDRGRFDSPPFMYTEFLLRALYFCAKFAASIAWIRLCTFFTITYYRSKPQSPAAHAKGPPHSGPFAFSCRPSCRDTLRDGRQRCALQHTFSCTASCIGSIYSSMVQSIALR